MLSLLLISPHVAWHHPTLPPPRSPVLLLFFFSFSFARFPSNKSLDHRPALCFNPSAVRRIGPRNAAERGAPLHARQDVRGVGPGQLPLGAADAQGGPASSWHGHGARCLVYHFVVMSSRLRMRVHLCVWCMRVCVCACHMWSCVCAVHVLCMCLCTVRACVLRCRCFCLVYQVRKMVLFGGIWGTRNCTPLSRCQLCFRPQWSLLG